MAPSRHHVEKAAELPQNRPGRDEDEEDEEEEEDYMTMALPTAAPKETPLQRLQRQKREALARGAPKSKSELAAEEAKRREEIHSRSLLDDAPDRGSKGLAMMAKMGFRGGALGKGEGVTEPIRVFVKGDRGGVGMDEEKRKREREEEAEWERERKARKVGEGEYRERVAKEREAERLERQYRAAAKLAQQLQEQKEEEASASNPEAPPQPDAPDDKEKKAQAPPPLRSINILWRPLVRDREQAERDRAARRALDEGLTRLPTFEEDLDADEKLAVGADKTEYVQEEGEDDEDTELEEFEALEPGERLTRVLEYLRKEHYYCFWCKCAYDDAEMEGCPGITEEEHD